MVPVPLVDLAFGEPGLSGQPSHCVFGPVGVDFELNDQRLDLGFVLPSAVLLPPALRVGLGAALLLPGNRPGPALRSGFGGNSLRLRYGLDFDLLGSGNGGLGAVESSSTFAVSLVEDLGRLLLDLVVLVKHRCFGMGLIHLIMTIELVVFALILILNLNHFRNLNTLISTFNNSDRIFMIPKINALTDNTVLRIEIFKSPAPHSNFIIN